MRLTALLLILLALVVGAAAQERTRTFNASAVGMQFEHPANWKVENRRGFVTFTIPGEDGNPAGRVELFSSVYRQEPEIWQRLQNTINENMKRRVERQWQEEILGVPLLMTQIVYEESGIETRSLVGLIYSASERKMNFRLTAPASTYDGVVAAWREALTTLRTNTGRLPQTEDPNRPVDNRRRPGQGEQPARGTQPDTRPPLRLTAQPDNRKPELGPVQVPVTVQERRLILRLPAGWSAATENDVLRLTGPGLVGTVTVTVANDLEGTPPGRALLARVNEGLADFTKVDLREDSPIRRNRAGAEIAWVRRTGAGAEGPLTQLFAAGASGNDYWILRYVGNGEAGRRDRKLLETLVDGMSLELAP